MNSGNKQNDVSSTNGNPRYQNNLGEKTSNQLCLVLQNQSDKVTSSGFSSTSTEIVTKNQLNTISTVNSVISYDGTDIDVAPKKKPKVLNIRKYSSRVGSSTTNNLSKDASSGVSNSILSKMTGNQTSNGNILVTKEILILPETLNSSLNSFSGSVPTNQFKFNMNRATVVPFDSLRVSTSTANQDTIPSIERVTRNQTSKFGSVMMSNGEASSTQVQNQYDNVSSSGFAKRDGSKPRFECSVCGKQYCREKPFRKHLRAHEEQNEEAKEFRSDACLICEKIVPVCPLSGIRPTHCKTCIRKFTGIKNLNKEGSPLVVPVEAPSEAATKAAKPAAVRKEKVAARSPREDFMRKLRNIKMETEAPQLSNSSKASSSSSSGKTALKKKISSKRKAVDYADSPFRCTICPVEQRRGFKNKYLLKAHKKLHFEPKLTCSFPDCEKKFHTTGNLKVHEKTHTKKKR